MPPDETDSRICEIASKASRAVERLLSAANSLPLATSTSAPALRRSVSPSPLEASDSLEADRSIAKARSRGCRRPRALRVLQRFDRTRGDTAYLQVNATSGRGPAAAESPIYP